MASFRSKYNNLKAEYESGMTTRQLATFYGESMSNIYLALKRRGVQFKPWKPPLDPKYNPIIEAYKKGLSTRQLASYFGISKSAIWIALKRRGFKMRPQARRGIENNLYRGGSRVEIRYNQIIAVAIRQGILIPEPCEICGASRKIGKRIVAHHDDYNYPLTVRWLCMKHHYDWHKHHTAIPLKTI